MNHSYKNFLMICLGIFFCIPLFTFARVGVGIGTGKISVDAPLRPGEIYTLPSLVVLNTGDEPAEYSLVITYQYEQPQERPSQDWFSFKPMPFQLNPGKSRVVDITLTLPVKTKPGDYFAYIEARPKLVSHSGSATIGIAAAAKLYFSVIPANIWQGMWYRLSTFYKYHRTILLIIFSILFAVIIILFVRKHFNIQIGLKK